ncbi:hypothetical protein CLOM_g14534 [Closterium sp. NIES-68]|nr:hypothetical protein CLOM_g14534 [Closterium sp. NIES-68]
MQLRVNLPIPSVVTVRLSLSPELRATTARKRGLKKTLVGVTGEGNQNRGSPWCEATWASAPQGTSAAHLTNSG